MKFPHWLVVVLLVASACAPILLEKTPAKYAAVATVLVGIIGTLKVEALKGEDK